MFDAFTLSLIVKAVNVNVNDLGNSCVRNLTYIVVCCFLLTNEIQAFCQGHQSSSILCKWLDEGERSLCKKDREDIGCADRSSQQLLQAKAACLVWLFACAGAVTSHFSVFNKPSALPREPLSLSSIQPLELLPTITHAPPLNVSQSRHIH